MSWHVPFIRNPPEAAPSSSIAADRARDPNHWDTTGAAIARIQRQALVPVTPPRTDNGAFQLVLAIANTIATALNIYTWGTITWFALFSAIAAVWMWVTWGMKRRAPPVDLDAKMAALEAADAQATALMAEAEAIDAGPQAPPEAPVTVDADADAATTERVDRESGWRREAEPFHLGPQFGNQIDVEFRNGGTHMVIRRPGIITSTTAVIKVPESGSRDEHFWRLVRSIR